MKLGLGSTMRNLDVRQDATPAINQHSALQDSNESIDAILLELQRATSALYVPQLQSFRTNNSQDNPS